MKTVFLLLLMPAFAIGQTIHVKDKKIIYEGKEDLGRPVNAVTVEKGILRGMPKNYEAGQQVGDSLEVYGKMKLESPYHLVRYVNYHFKLTSLKNGYEYVIDSVYFTERERGGKEDTVSSEKMLDKMGDTGNIVGKTEKILNETDMRFQKLIAIIRSEMKKS